ncbi:TolB family protein [Kineococcus rhizosphaerae]|uniref:Tol biopolymer transport system component n=1 Tax=Kineococcus rhizosphaerae TaxID=559628 RepID=A0A2T0R6N1_9ACTN|nr:hypothetical protein [Kineococcus rhizosphaerae]PRY16824.1 Tol biopolymer transport system component [Kineococcus rhizosphaerae]
MRRRWSTAVVLAAALVLTPLPATARSTGQELAFTGWVGADVRQRLLVLDTADTATAEPRTVAPGGIADLAWSADGSRLAWIGFEEPTGPVADTETTLYSARPDGTDRRTLLAGSSLADVAAAPDGGFAVARSDVRDLVDCAGHPPVPAADITLVSPAGRTRRLTDTPVNTWALQFSRDGADLVWASSDGDPCGSSSWPHLNLTDVATGTTRAVTGARSLQSPTFSGDGRTVLAATSDEFGDDLVRVDVATASARRVQTPGFSERLPSVSPSGDTVAVVRTAVVPDPHTYFRPVQDPHVAVLDLEGNLLRDLGAVDLQVDQLAWSPDGSTVAVAGANFVPDTPGSDVGSADPAVWTFPTAGGTPRRLSDSAGFATAGLAFRPTFPDPPTLVRGTRDRR